MFFFCKPRKESKYFSNKTQKNIIKAKGLLRKFSYLYIQKQKKKKNCECICKVKKLTKWNFIN